MIKIRNDSESESESSSNKVKGHSKSNSNIVGKGLNPEIYDDTGSDCRPVFRRSTTDCACMIPRMNDKSFVSGCPPLPSTPR